VINSTEDFVKYEQDWPGMHTLFSSRGTFAHIRIANIKAREKQQQLVKEKADQQRKEGDGQAKDRKSSTEEHDIDADHGSETSSQTQHSSQESSQSSSDSEENNDEDDWRQNRGGEHSDKHSAAYGSSTQAKHEDDAEYKQLRKKYTPQEIALLRSLRNEKEYIHGLGQNDGTMVSPVRIQDSENLLFSIDTQDTMTPDNW